MTTRAGTKTSIRLGRAAGVALLLFLAVICVVPLTWLLFAPSKTWAELSNLPPLAFGNFEGYATAWNNLVSYDNGILYRWIGNTAWYSAVTVIVAVVTATMAGYALATTRMQGRRTLLSVTLLAMIVPGAALVLPLFLQFNLVQLTNTPWAVILPSSLFPFGVYLAYLHFATSIPQSLFEAARRDGATEWRVFTRIALPLSWSLVAMLSFFAFVAAWTNYFLPFVMLTDQSTFTLQLGLQTLLASGAVTSYDTITDLPVRQPEAMVATIVAILPIAIVFIVSQRFIARGLVGGAVKD